MSDHPSPTKVAVFARMTPMLLFCCFIGAIGEIIYGYDVSSFGGVQAIPAFRNQFGDCNAAGVCSLSTTTAAIMNSFASIGKFVGCFVVGEFLERFGHRWSLVATCVLNILGAVLEITAKHPAQFVAGRVILYFSVAFCEVTVTTYQAELVPANMRAFVGKSSLSGLQFFITIGGLVATGINKAFSTRTDPAGWMIPVGVTMVFPAMVLCGIPFIPDAPRWLLFHGRHEDAVKSLRRVRPSSDVDGGLCEVEVDAMAEAMRATPKKGSWIDLFRGTNLRRTMIVIFAMTAQQCSGQAFVSQYGTVFYLSVGLGDKAFTYPLIASALTLIPVLGSMYLMDKIGRRPIYIFGGFFMAFWMFCVSGFGGSSNPSGAQIDMVVASTIMFNVAFGLTWAPAPYTTAAEMSSSALREKTMALGSAAQSLSGWAISFILPYLLNKPYAGLGPRVGWIFGSLCCLLSVMAFFIIPETKGRVLEEIDQLFEQNVRPWSFSKVKTAGTAHRVGELQREDSRVDEKGADIEECEQKQV